MRSFRRASSGSCHGSTRASSRACRGAATWRPFSMIWRHRRRDWRPPTRAPRSPTAFVATSRSRSRGWPTRRSSTSSASPAASWPSVPFVSTWWSSTREAATRPEGTWRTLPMVTTTRSRMTPTTRRSTTTASTSAMKTMPTGSLRPRRVGVTTRIITPSPRIRRIQSSRSSPRMCESWRPRTSRVI